MNTEQATSGSGGAHPSDHSVILGESLDISLVQVLHEELQQAIQQGGRVVVDATAVERADTAGLQLLLALAEAARLQGVDLRWQGVSQDLKESLGLLGLTEFLGVS